MNEMITKMRHVGIIVKDMDKSVESFKNLFGLKDADIRQLSADDTGGAGRFAFIPVGGTELELIQPVADYFIEMLGNHGTAGINHVAFVVTDIEEMVRMMAEKGIRLGHITKEGIMDAGQMRIAYLDPEDTDGILIELVQPAS